MRAVIDAFGAEIDAADERLRPPSCCGNLACKLRKRPAPRPRCAARTPERHSRCHPRLRCRHGGRGRRRGDLRRRGRARRAGLGGGAACVRIQRQRRIAKRKRCRRRGGRCRAVFGSAAAAALGGLPALPPRPGGAAAAPPAARGGGGGGAASTRLGTHRVADLDGLRWCEFSSARSTADDPGAGRGRRLPAGARSGHRAATGLVFDIDRLLLARNKLFVSALVNAIVDQLARLRILGLHCRARPCSARRRP